MSKKHIKQAIKVLAIDYSDAQRVYESAAEVLSTEMVSPEVYNTFNSLKDILDITLSNYSAVLQEALSRPKFIKSMSKINQSLIDIDKLYFKLQNEPTSEDLLQNIQRRRLSLASLFDLYCNVNRLSCIKNRQKLKEISLPEIEQNLSNLKTYVERNL